MATGIAPLEVKALAKIIDELSYYQILHLEPGASSRELKRRPSTSCSLQTG